MCALLQFPGISNYAYCQSSSTPIIARQYDQYTTTIRPSFGYINKPIQALKGPNTDKPPNMITHDELRL
jgi:hypothetical protein